MAWKFITVSYLFVLLSSCAPDGGESDGDIPEKPIFEEAPQSGIKDGHIIERYENGSPKEEFHLVNGKKNGSFKTWYEDGQLAKEGKMVEDRWHGLYQEWRPDGTQRVKGSYVNGVQDGEWNFYSKEGKALPPVLFEMGKEVTRELPALGF